MSQVYKRTISQLQQLKKKKQSKGLIIYEFFESLLYGNWLGSKNILKHYNFYTKRSSQCVIFLNQHHVQLLTCLDKTHTGVRMFFNMKKIQIADIHSQYEMDQNLQKDKYLVLKEKQQEVILLFENTTIRNQFRQNIEQLKKIFVNIPNMYDPLILKAFVKADINQNDEINWQQLKHLVRIMKIDLSDTMKSFIKKIIGKQKLQKIYFSQFQRLWRIFYCRQQLCQIFQKYNKQKFNTFNDYLEPRLDEGEIKRFLLQEQKESQQDCIEIVKQLLQGSQPGKGISFYSFCLYVFGQRNNLIDNPFKKIEIDSSRPLNHYYCYSSHNTYLTGNQLTSNSRVERYFHDLQNGLRCVEVDVHDGDGPIVKHGYTLTSAITFQDVIKEINRFTLIDSNHSPIILSIENHCNQENQVKMAHTLTDIFGDKILKVNAQSKHFPVLKDCLGKILIKGPGNFKLFEQNIKSKSQKVLECEYTQSQDSQDQDLGYKGKKSDENQQFKSFFSENFKNLQSNFSSRVNQLQNEKKKFQEKKKIFKKIKTQPTQMHQVLRQHQVSQKKMKQNPKYHQKFKVSGKLLQLISLLSKACLQNTSNCHWQSLSFGEKKIMDLFSRPQQIKRIRQYSFLKWFRSYPGGMRIDSSNYDPLPSLQLGIQIVAINTQKQNDVNVHILKAFFMKGINKVTGYRQRTYIEKLRIKSGHDQNQSYSKVHRPQQFVKVEVVFLSALRIYQNDEYADGIPPVCIQAFFTGTERDNILNSTILEKKQFTDMVCNNAFNPKFKQICPLQIKCRDPQLGFLVIQVPECGRSVVPMEAMKPGWRVVSLYDHQLKEKQSKILCKIKVIKS